MLQKRAPYRPRPLHGFATRSSRSISPIRSTRFAIRFLHPATGRSPARLRGYTLIEMMVTVAALIVLLGLMTSLARHVRTQAAKALTKDLLRQLDDMASRYALRNDGKLPRVSLFPPPPQAPPAGSVAGNGTRDGLGRSQPQAPTPSVSMTVPDESDPVQRQRLLAAAGANSRDFVAALKAEPEGTDFLSRLPLSIYDEKTLRDAWGSPIVFMPAKHPWVGTAPRDHPFFFSAGPDRRYLTQSDNLYSYEDLSLERLKPFH